MDDAIMHGVAIPTVVVLHDHEWVVIITEVL